MARKTATKNVEPATTREVRAWALENSIEGVGQRGKIRAEVVEAFTTATGRPLATA